MQRLQNLARLPTSGYSVLIKHKLAAGLAASALVVGLPALALAVGASADNTSAGDVNQPVKSHSEPTPANSEIKLEAHTDSSSDVSSSSIVKSSGAPKVSVNGQAIEVPANGNVQTTVPSDDGSAQVNVNIESSQQGTSDNHNSSSTRVRINSRSSVNVNEGGQ